MKTLSHNSVTGRLGKPCCVVDLASYLVPCQALLFGGFEGSLNGRVEEDAPLVPALIKQLEGETVYCQQMREIPLCPVSLI